MKNKTVFKAVSTLAASSFLTAVLLAIHVPAQSIFREKDEGSTRVLPFAEGPEPVEFSPPVYPSAEDYRELAPELERSLTPDSEVDTSRKNEFMVWGGYSPDSTTALPSAGSKDARFGIVGLKYARRFNNNSTYNLKYTAEVYPIAGLSFVDNGIRDSEYAFGFSPFGVQMNFRPRKKFQPFVGAAGGALIFSKRIPSDLGTRFNFTADFSAGVEIRAGDNQSVSLGYKFFHISNAGRGQINPSYDNNVIFAGYSYLF